MPSIILSDNGVSSGSAGLKSTAASDGALALQTTTAGGTATTAVTIDTSQNMGLGVTPSAWTVFSPVFQIKTSSGAAALAGNANDNIRLFNNAYYDGAYKRIGAGYASYYEQDAGKHAWHIAGTSTAGSTVSFTQAMTLDSAGFLGIGPTSPTAPLDVLQRTSDDDNALQLRGYTTGSDGTRTVNVRAVSSNAGDWANLQFKAQSIRFIYQGGTERARIDSSGNLLVGTTSTVSNARFVSKSSTSSSSDQAFQFQNSSGSVLLTCRADGYLISLPVYNTTSGSAANVFVNVDGGLYRSTSSLKYKTDVQDATHGLEKVMQLRPVTYKGKSEADIGKTFGGLIAEEVHDAGLTEFVQYAADGTPDALAYGNMVSLAFKAIQEQQAIITELKARLDAANL